MEGVLQVPEGSRRFAHFDRVNLVVWNREPVRGGYKMSPLGKVLQEQHQFISVQCSGLHAVDGKPCLCFCYTAPQLYMQHFLFIWNEKCENTLVYGPILTIN